MNRAGGKTTGDIEEIGVSLQQEMERRRTRREEREISGETWRRSLNPSARGRGEQGEEGGEEGISRET